MLRKREIRVMTKMLRNPTSHENIVSSFGKNEKNPSSQENFVSSFGKNEKNPRSHDDVKNNKILLIMRILFQSILI